MRKTHERATPVATVIAPAAPPPPRMMRPLVEFVLLPSSLREVVNLTGEEVAGGSVNIVVV
jgi:hypothetical protein